MCLPNMLVLKVVSRKEPFGLPSLLWLTSWTQLGWGPTSHNLINRFLLEGIGDLDKSWRIKGTSSIIFSQAKSFGLSYLYHISIAPPCGNMNSTHLHWKLLAPLHVLVLFLACVCICCASYLLNLSNQGCVCWLAHHVCVFCVWAYWILLYLNWLLWDINELFHFGGVWCPWAPHNPKCVYMRNTT